MVNVNTTSFRVVIVQYAGDYREAFERFASGGAETYYAQRDSVDLVGTIRKQVGDVTVICGITSEPYDQVLANGVRAIGAGFKNTVVDKDIIPLIAAQQPTHLILRFPSRPLLSWAIKAKLKILVTLADSFPTKGLRNKVKNFLLTRLLNNRQVDWVGNHGTTSSQLLQTIGVNPDKIIPWDFPHHITPAEFTPKTKSETDHHPCNLIYVGTVSEPKGVGDLLQALHILHARQLPFHLKIAGKGDVEVLQARAQQLQIADYVEFLGLVPNKQIVHLMREADIVIVPSRHEYPEGFPLTLYEAMCSRTPIVASDHPMFQTKLQHKTNALIFPAENADALADCIAMLISDTTLYQTLSFNSEQAWNQLQIPVKWNDLIERWLFDSPENHQWLYQYRLSSGLYSEI